MYFLSICPQVQELVFGLMGILRAHYMYQSRVRVCFFMTYDDDSKPELGVTPFHLI